MSQTFKLRDVKGQEVEVDSAEITAVVKTVPEGSVVVEQAALDTLQTQVTSLSADNASLKGQVTSLATTAADESKQRRTLQLTSELDRLSKGAFITKPERDWAAKTFGEAMDLSGFLEWAATKTQAIVHLNREEGSGADAALPVRPVATLMTLANTIVKEEGLSLRDALIQAGRREAAAAVEYRNEFLPQT